MKNFVSSLISDFESIRAAAKGAIEDLGYDPIMAEDFVPGPHSPQVACLTGVRDSALVLLLLGGEYGRRQPSGYSATEEEFREARESRPVIAFVQNGAARSSEQNSFVKEVEGWTGGHFRGAFDGPDDLRRKIVRALHEWEISNASGSVDQAGLTEAARAMIAPPDRNWSTGSGPNLLLGIASGPSQPILRPSEIEAPALKEKLLKEALFGTNRVFESGLGSETRLRESSLVLTQQCGAEIVLDPQGNIRIKLPISNANGGRHGVSAIIEEDVRDLLARGIGFAEWVLGEIDPTQRLTHSAAIVSIEGASVHTWRTRQQHAASPERSTMRMANDDPAQVMLSPAVRPRTALRFDRDRIVDDFVSLLSRAYRT